MFKLLVVSEPSQGLEVCHQQIIRAVAISETDVCLECHRRFETKYLKKPIKNAHEGLQFILCSDKIKTFSSTKVLHCIVFVTITLH